MLHKTIRRLFCFVLIFKEKDFAELHKSSATPWIETRGSSIKGREEKAIFLFPLQLIHYYTSSSKCKIDPGCRSYESMTVKEAGAFQRILLEGVTALHLRCWLQCERPPVMCKLQGIGAFLTNVFSLSRISWVIPITLADLICLHTRECWCQCPTCVWSIAVISDFHICSYSCSQRSNSSSENIYSTLGRSAPSFPGKKLVLEWIIALPCAQGSLGVHMSKVLKSKYLQSCWLSKWLVKLIT